MESPLENITPPIDLYNLNKLPFDLQKKTALNLSLKEIGSLCKSSKGLNEICKNKYFWRDYMIKNIQFLCKRKHKLQSQFQFLKYSSSSLSNCLIRCFLLKKQLK